MFLFLNCNSEPYLLQDQLNSHHVNCDCMNYQTRAGLEGFWSLLQKLRMASNLISWALISTKGLHKEAMASSSGCCVGLQYCIYDYVL